MDVKLGHILTTVGHKYKQDNLSHMEQEKREGYNAQKIALFLWWQTLGVYVGLIFFGFCGQLLTMQPGQSLICSLMIFLFLMG